MAKQRKSLQRFSGGIADYSKESLIADSFYFAKCIDHRSDPRKITLLPKTIKESGSVVTDLPLWAESALDTNTYLYGNTGNLYKRTTLGSYSNIRSVASSHGNGLAYFQEDDFLYYASDKTFGRYGPVQGTSPQFVDDLLGSQGGTPQNTNSISLVAASSQYASRADTSTLSITGNLTAECYIKPTTLPTSGNSMTLLSKWDESGALRSYKFDIATTSAAFGDGSDGALTVSTDTTHAPIDSACTGTTGTTTLTATNVSFAANQKILIVQMYGTGAGTYQINTISGYTAGTITTQSALNATYVTGAQVIVLKQYTDVTVNAGVTWTMKAYNGTVGGILAFLANGTLTVNGTINGVGKGFRGATSVGYQGEGTSGAGSQLTTANGNGGGGGGPTGVKGYGGGGGGNGTNGQKANFDRSADGIGVGGLASGSADLTTITLGGGGGAGTYAGVGSVFGSGGNGGGMLITIAQTITFGANASVDLRGSNGGVVTSGVYNGNLQGGGGGGGAGSYLARFQTGTFQTDKINLEGGLAGYNGNANSDPGGDGALGRVHFDYYTSYTGTNGGQTASSQYVNGVTYYASGSPAIDAVQDNTLGSSTGYVLRLTISGDGSNSSVMSYPASLLTGVWQHVAVTYAYLTSTTSFYLNGLLLGTSVGSLTTIHDNVSTFQIGMNKNATVPANFYDGLMDDIKLWASVRSQEELIVNMQQEVLSTSAFLRGYWKVNGNVNDATSNANNLTASGSPTYSSDVPFPSPATRLDIDQTATTAGNTYTTPVAISEAATARKTFTPAKDPQKSVSFLVAAVGTGDWTVTVHDGYNNVIASKTVTNANMATGYLEFIFSSVWRPIINNSYHFHVTSTVADGTVTTTTSGDLETVSFRTYYQFLVEDNWHPILNFLTYLVIANERYVGTWEATVYNPHQLTLPAGWHVRSFATWKEYLAIGCVKGDSVTENESGAIFFWDGISTTYNFFLEVPEGGINAMLGTKGKLYVWAGYQGDLFIYEGSDSATIEKRLPKVTDATYSETYPGAVGMWKGLVRFGVSNSDSSDIYRGVYTYGKRNKRYEDSLSFDYIPSTGNSGSTIKIGMVKVVNQKLLIGYQDNVSYGVDYVDASNAPYSSGFIEFLIQDNDLAWKEKELVVDTAAFLPLVSGESIDIGYQLDRSNTYTMLGAVTTAGEKVARQPVIGGRYRELQLKVELATSATTSPTLIGVAYEYDDLESESII